METPWGKSQTDECLGVGLHWVTTASHGGLMITKARAEKQLSPNARQFAGRYGSYLCFEEDCAYAIAFYEQPLWKRELDMRALADWNRQNHYPDSYMDKAKKQAIPRLQAEIAKTDTQIRDEMREIVESWYPEYFADPASEANDMLAEYDSVPLEIAEFQVEMRKQEQEWGE